MKSLSALHVAQNQSAAILQSCISTNQIRQLYLALSILSLIEWLDTLHDGIVNADFGLHAVRARSNIRVIADFEALLELAAISESVL